MKKHGFVYIWRDKKYNMYYVGCHWGREDDGYICSSNWMRRAYRRRPIDFKRRIIKTNILNRSEMYVEEQKYLDMIKKEEIKIKYYNLNLKNGNLWHQYPESIKTIGQKISFSKKGKNTGPRDPSVGKSISEAKKAKNRKLTDEHKQKLREAKLGKKLSAEHKEKVIKTLGKNNENWRKSVSEAAKKRWEQFRLNKTKEQEILANS